MSTSRDKEQSATILGLTALLSSKLIYNIQNRIKWNHGGWQPAAG